MNANQLSSRSLTPCEAFRANFYLLENNLKFNAKRKSPKSSQTFTINVKCEISSVKIFGFKVKLRYHLLHKNFYLPPDCKGSLCHQITPDIFCTYLFALPWASYLICLCLSFPICQMRKVDAKLPSDSNSIILHITPPPPAECKLFECGGEMLYFCLYIPNAYHCDWQIVDT